ncbi:MAG: hypothetical protein V4585_22775 [Bacteroidota bacterium]
MKIKELIQKIALCIVPVALCIIAYLIAQDAENSKSDSLLSGISTFNATIIVIYISLGRDRMINGDEKMLYLAKKVDSLIILNQICLGIILILFYTKFSGVISLTQAYTFILLILYGNYYSLRPMPAESISIYFEDEDIWRKYCKLRGRLFFIFGVIGLSLVFYLSPEGLGRNSTMIIFGTMLITFILTYFYAKREYFKKFDR